MYNFDRFIQVDFGISISPIFVPFKKTNFETSDKISDENCQIFFGFKG